MLELGTMIRLRSLSKRLPRHLKCLKRKLMLESLAMTMKQRYNNNNKIIKIMPMTVEIPLLSKRIPGEDYPMENKLTTTTLLNDLG